MCADACLTRLALALFRSSCVRQRVRRRDGLLLTLVRNRKRECVPSGKVESLPGLGWSARLSPACCRFAVSACWRVGIELLCPMFHVTALAVHVPTHRFEDSALRFEGRAKLPILYYIIVCYIILYYVILYYIMLYYIILYYIIFYIIVYYIIFDT